MSRKYILGGVIADDDYILSETMEDDQQALYIPVFRFYDTADKATRVQKIPTAGTIVVQSSQDEVNYFTLANGSFNADQIYIETRTIINGLGPARKVKITLDSIAGTDVNFFEAEIHRHTQT